MQVGFGSQIFRGRQFAPRNRLASNLPTREPLEPAEKFVASGAPQEPSPPSKSWVRAVVREASYWTRRLCLSLANIPASIFGVGLGSSPAGLTGASELHKKGIDGSGVRVAVIDQGFTKFGAGDEDVVGVYNANTGEFKQQLEESKTDIAYEMATKQKGFSFHGNAMAGIITGETLGMKGIAPGAEVLGISVLDDQKRLTPKVFIDGLRWLAAHHQEQQIAAVSISLAYFNPTDTERDEVQRLFSQLRREGVSVVVAAGNRGPGAGSANFPSTLNDAISAGSFTQGFVPGPYDDRIDSYSGRGGQGVRGPHLIGPGGSLFTKDHNGLVDLTSGTSNVAPMVVGSLALLKQAFPQATVEEREQALFSTARPVTGNRDEEGYGAFNVGAAHDLLAQKYPS